jgi:GT2 family glycosyltransferase
MTHRNEISGRMKIAVAIPTRGRDSLADLLSAIARISNPIPFSVFVYANGVGAFEQTSEIVSRFPSLLVDVRNGAVGFASSRNSALSELRSRFDLIIFLDDDVVPTGDSIALLTSAAEESEERVMLSGFSHRLPEVPNKLHALQYPVGRKAPSGEPSCLPGYMLAVKTKVLVPEAVFPSALDRTGGEDTALTWWLHSNGWSLSYVDGALCTEIDAKSRLNASTLMFRRIASSAVLRLCRRSQLAPWRWTQSECGLIAARLMAIVQTCCCLLARVSPWLGYQAARLLGAAFGHAEVLPTLDDKGRWRVTRIRTRTA